MEYLPEYLTIPAAELSRRSKVRLVILPDLPALFQHFARSIADEILENNRRGLPTRLILPVGPAGAVPDPGRDLQPRAHLMEECFYIQYGRILRLAGRDPFPRATR